MKAPLKRRLADLESHVRPAETLVGNMTTSDFITRLSSAESEEFRAALESIGSGPSDQAGRVIRATIALAKERKAAGLIIISERKPPAEYNAEIREARKVYGTDAWRHVSMRVEYIIDENDISKLSRSYY